MMNMSLIDLEERNPDKSDLLGKRHECFGSKGMYCDRSLIACLHTTRVIIRCLIYWISMATI